jgi:hypothetical protein
LIRESGLVAEDRTPEPGVEVAPVEAAGDLIPVTGIIYFFGGFTLFPSSPVPPPWL